MERLHIVRVESPEGYTLLNLDNVSAIEVDENGSFGSRLELTVHLNGGGLLNYKDEHADALLQVLERAGIVLSPPAGP